MKKLINNINLITHSSGAGKFKMEELADSACDEGPPLTEVLHMGPRMVERENKLPQGLISP